MIGFFRKINWGAVLVCGLLFVAMNSPFASAIEKLPPEKAYLDGVYQNMMEVYNLHYDVAIKAETPMGEMHAAIKGDFQEKPLSLMQDITINYRDVQNKENIVLLKQYAEQNKDNLVVYLLNNETWIKQVMPVSPSLGKKLSADEKASARLGMLQLLKAVKLKKETPSYKYMEITLDTMQISDVLGADVNSNNTQDKDMLRALAVARLGLLAAGDIKYTLKIDKATQMIKEADMDLTEPIRKGARLFLEIANPKDKAAIEAFLAKSTLNMQVIYSKYNQVEPIEIPQTVRDNAKEVKPPVKASPKKND